MGHEIPHATALESLTFSLLYSLPEFARGIVIRRPAMTRRLARLDAHRFCMRLRVRYGGRSLYVRGPRGKTLLLLSQGDVERVLTGSDSVFSLRTEEKWRGFSPVQPDGLLLSRGEEREDRRRFTHAVLQPGQASHDLARRIDQVMAEELDAILGRSPGVVHWARLRDRYYRAILRVVLGDAARDDVQILGALNALRGEGNWLGLRPWRRKRMRRLRRAMMAGVGYHVAVAADGSLAGLCATAPQTPHTCPAGQLPHWLMALESLGTTVIGPTLALLAGHPEHYERARAGDRDHLRACLYESLRLWPLVPTLPRVVTTPTGWHGAMLAAGTDIVIPVAVHNRNPQIDYADAFTPQVWLDGRASADWWIVPFSGGPGRCPGADLGIQVGVSALAALLRQYDFHPIGPKLGPDRPLPKTLDPFSLRLKVSPRSQSSQTID
ncbi:Cytochrome P450 [Nonomuraea solani]|uniref:Cytochrome P450 n=1 Tax=Nonomuraea solani TaxID=1144553 RepID=A0A1H6EIL3_9ACTN|nr:cytochrome P450 [Nonomuraea solani]SEG97720.1 Cytochrome P450 [Nonomuraea solani]